MHLLAHSFVEFMSRIGLSAFARLLRMVLSVPSMTKILTSSGHIVCSATPT